MPRYERMVPLPNTNALHKDEEIVDYVLVTESIMLHDTENMKLIRNFLNSLQQHGVTVFADYGKLYNEYCFFRLTLSDDAVTYLSDLHGVELTCNSPFYSSIKRPLFSLLDTELDRRDASRIAARAPEAVMDIRPTRATKAERAQLIYLLMSTTWFDVGVTDYGIDKMLGRKLFVGAFPIHDGLCFWTEVGSLTNRQLLAKYWANFSCILKNQPLNVIEKYFGTEVAMYFAFTEFYLKYLCIAAVVGVIFYCIGLITSLITGFGMVRDEICNSNITICPMCMNPDYCKYSNIRDHCLVHEISTTIDNVVASIYAIFIAVWSICFVFFWKRHLNRLRMNWNVVKVRAEKTLRPEYTQKASRVRKNTATGEQEYYRPTLEVCFATSWTMIATLLGGLFFMAISISTVLLQTFLKHVVTDGKSTMTRQTAYVVGEMITPVSMMLQIFIFGVWQSKIAMKLTERETPSTMYYFDKSYVRKHAILMFANGFASVVYLTFIRGIFYKYPRDFDVPVIIREFGYELCGPAGCFVSLIVFMGSTFFMSTIKGLFWRVVMRLAKVFYYKRRYRWATSPLHQWELDWALLETNRRTIFSDVFTLVSQYAYIVSFVVAFPLAPLLAVIRNLVQIRLDAIFYLKQTQKIMPKKSRGLGAYNKILKWVTHIGMFINGCVIAFSSSTISWLMHKFYYQTPDGYYKFMLSEFDTANFEHKNPDGSEVCFYPGMRHPPSSEDRYALKEEYFVILVVQLLFLIVYEHILLFIRALLRGYLHEKPKDFKEKVLHQDDLLKEARQKILHDLHADTTHQHFPDAVRIPSPMPSPIARSSPRNQSI